MERDTARASHYKKVRAAIAIYREAEKDYLIQYSRSCGEMLEADRRNKNKTDTAETLKDNNVLPDFVTVMGSCLSVHWARSYKKLGKKYKKAMDEAEKKAKIEEAKKLEKRNGERVS